MLQELQYGYQEQIPLAFAKVRPFDYFPPKDYQSYLLEEQNRNKQNKPPSKLYQPALLPKLSEIGRETPPYQRRNYLKYGKNKIKQNPFSQDNIIREQQKHELFARYNLRPAANPLKWEGPNGPYNYSKQYNSSQSNSMLPPLYNTPQTKKFQFQQEISYKNYNSSSQLYSGQQYNYDNFQSNNNNNFQYDNLYPWNKEQNNELQRFRRALNPQENYVMQPPLIPVFVPFAVPDTYFQDADQEKKKKKKKNRKKKQSQINLNLGGGDSKQNSIVIQNAQAGNNDQVQPSNQQSPDKPNNNENDENNNNQDTNKKQSEQLNSLEDDEYEDD